MKLKKLFLGLTSVTSLAGVTAVLMSSVSCTSKNNELFGEQNSSYAFLTFKSDDPEVKFVGNTTVKVKKGKVFGAIVPPKATKPYAEFKNWYYINDAGQQVDLEPTTIIDKDLEIQPLFSLIPVPGHTASMTFDLLFQSNQLGDIPGELYEGYNVTIFNIGTTFDDITKPIVVPAENMKAYGFVFIGWYDSPYDDGNRILNDFVPTTSMTVYAHYTTYQGPNTWTNPYPLSQSLNFTATSENATVTLQCEGDTVPDDVKYCYDFQYDLNPDSQQHEWVKTFQEGVPIEVEKGHTLCVFAGNPESLSPFSYPSDEPGRPNYRHFQISGDIWLSGSLESLIDGGSGAVRIENLIDQVYYNGEYGFYKLFDYATNGDPNSHLHISHDIAYQKDLYSDEEIEYYSAPFMPFTTIGASVFGSMFIDSGLENIPYSLLKPRKDSNGIDTVTIRGGNALQSMFYNCVNITSIPEDLFAYFNPAQYGQDRTCYLMFNNCSGLKGDLPDKLLSNLPAGSYCFANMFAHCTNITGVGERFLAPVGAANMCDNMFADCPSLVNLPTHLMNTDTPISGSFTQQFYHMFYDCGSIVEIPKGFLSNSVSSLGSQACAEMFSSLNGTSNVRRINAFLPFTDTTVYAAQSVQGIFGTNEKNVEYIDPDFFKNLNANVAFGTRSLNYLFSGMGTYYDKDGTTILGKWEITEIADGAEEPSSGHLFLDLTLGTSTTLPPAAFVAMFRGWKLSEGFKGNPTAGHKYYINFVPNPT